MTSATSIVKPLSMADGCLTSLSTQFTPKASYYPSISFPSRPVKVLHLSSTSSSSSFTSWVSLKNKISSSPVVTLVASTSDWAQQGENEFEEESEGGFVEKNSEVSYSEPSEEAKLFVGNLPFDVDSEKLAQLFDQAGVVEVSEVIYDRETDRSRGFAFVTMSSLEEAEKAVEMFNRYDINGRLLTVNKASPRGSRAERAPRGFESSLRIYVGNLPWKVDDARLEQIFSEHGKVVDSRIVVDRETGRSRGFGFVTLSTQTEVEDAIAALDGQSLEGRAIRVNVAEQKPRRGSF